MKPNPSRLSSKRPSTKLQRITKLQIPKEPGAQLVFECWRFFGCWSLDAWSFFL